jgi:LuxR family transcriptional regulator, maltose regulon positive regulatory protein
LPLSQPPLIKTRFTVPPLRTSLVARPRLLDLLPADSLPALSLVCAPAGYGKTTLLVEWISSLLKTGASQPPLVCWLSLDEEHNDTAIFLNYLVAALANGSPQIGSEARTLLHTFPPPPLKAILGALINDLIELPVPICLVLDDYQFISNTAIHEGIGFFLDRLPPAVHMLIATRSDPPLPLARLRARNQLIEIRADALRFTPQEVAAFLNQVMNLPLTVEEITTLDSRTEGWIAGLQMAALAMRGRSTQGRPNFTQFIEAFSGSHRYILDYLAEEALNRQPAAVQRFLSRTSILDRMSAPLCDAVLAENEEPSQGVLEYLHQSNLFLIALDEERVWFRYHRLFADLLQARLRQSHPGIIPTLHLRASGWYEQNGNAVEAIQHAFLAQADERAAGLIEQYGPARWSSGDPSILALITHLPSHLLTAHPRIGIYHAWMLIARGQSQEALPLLGRLKERTTIENDSPDFLWMRAVVQLLAAYAAPPDDLPMRTDLPDYELLERIPEQDSGLITTAEYLYAFLLSRFGEFERAAEISQSSLQRASSTGDSIAISLAVPLLARLLIMQGRLPEAATLCQKYLDISQEKGKHSLYSSGGLDIILGEVFYEWNDLDRAEQHARAGIRANAPWQNVMIDAIGYSDLAAVQSARGDLTGAAETMQQLEKLLQGRNETPDIEEELVTIQVRLWLAKSDQEHVYAWADQTAKTPISDTFQGWSHLTLVRVRLAQGRYVEAQSILEALASQPGAEKRVHRQVRVYLLLALAHFRQNRLPQAFQALETCLSLAQPGGYRRIFLDSGTTAQEILLAYLRSPRPMYREYVQQSLDTFSGGSSPAASTGQNPSGMLEPLTPRELEVLGHMAAGLSNRQIAEKLFLSEGTVKFHVHSILEKIRVHSRTQAIAKARELKLV